MCLRFRTILIKLIRVVWNSKCQRLMIALNLVRWMCHMATLPNTLCSAWSICSYHIRQHCCHTTGSYPLALAVGVLLWLPQWPLVAHKGQCRHNDNAGCVPGSLVTPLQAKAAWITDVHPAPTAAAHYMWVSHEFAKSSFIMSAKFDSKATIAAP